MKILILAVVLSLACVGCAEKRSVMTYAEAKPLFVEGMLPVEVEAKYGKPSVVVDLPGTVRWEYMPIREIERGGQSSYSGFSVIFKDNKAIALWEAETLAR